jgi:hypothetical protein
MNDLIRRSAANLLAISMTLANDTDDADDNVDTLVNEPAAHPDLSTFAIDQEIPKLDKK